MARRVGSASAEKSGDSVSVLITITFQFHNRMV